MIVVIVGKIVCINVAIVGSIVIAMKLNISCKIGSTYVCKNTAISLIVGMIAAINPATTPIIEAINVAMLCIIAKIDGAAASKNPAIASVTAPNTSMIWLIDWINTSNCFAPASPNKLWIAVLALSTPPDSAVLITFPIPDIAEIMVSKTFSASSPNVD